MRLTSATLAPGVVVVDIVVDAFSYPVASHHPSTLALEVSSICECDQVHH